MNDDVARSGWERLNRIRDRWPGELSATPYRRLLLILNAGGLLALSFPPYGGLIFLPASLVALGWAFEPDDPLEGARLGAAFCFVFYLLHTYWFVSFHPLALPFVLAVLCLWHALWGMGVHWLNLGPWGMAGGWMILEWFLAQGYLAFPWSRFSTALAASPWLIQPVRYLGEVGWDGLILITVLLLAQRWKSGTPSWFVVGGVTLVFAGVLVLGAYDYYRVEPGRTSRRVMMVQPNIPSSAPGAGHQERQLRRLIRLTREHQKPGDLVIWPETTVTGQPFVIRGPSIEWSQNESWKAFFDQTLDRNSDLLFGTMFYDPVPGQLPGLNGAVVVRHDLSVAGFYTKRIPVPGGEHLPLMGRWEWMRRLGYALGTLGFRAGRKGGLIPIQVEGTPWQLAVQICFEDAFPGYVRGQVRDGADVLVNISNDSWSRSRASHLQHFYRARLRAVETGRMVLRNGNTGITAIIDPMGGIVRRLGTYRTGVVRGRFIEPQPLPPIAQWGHWIPLLEILGFLLVGTWVRFEV